MQATETANPSFAVRAERRIARLTLVLGAAAAVAVAAAFSPRAGLGVFTGAVLAWINFRWLRQAIDALVWLSAGQPGEARPRISAWVYIKFFARYALMAAVIYVMVKYFDVPVLGLLAGLFSLGAAAMTESIYEIVTRSK
ncbi:MAG: ATP synthase subunit I [Acidobacteria bacterium]|nr:ATP synthase subunit I [Acidobacteriota bacterium]MBI3662474.1 ATP synthase subunit I [Acidobacteriota bacterium]